MMVDNLKFLGTVLNSSDQLKMRVNTGANCALHALSRRGRMLSGPAAFRSSNLANDRLTLCSDMTSDGGV